MNKREFASFRDPSGVVFMRGDVVYREINGSYHDNYRMLMDSGLYSALTENRLMIPHKEVDKAGFSGDAMLVIRPKHILFISYPYEWCFEQYRQAAITTLTIQLKALQYGMVLKDASAYNIQFYNGHAVLIDTLSFDSYQEGMPWGAYGQFCRHFLCPLLLMAKVDVRLSKLMTNYIDGIPLDLTASILRGKIGVFGLGHILLHSRSIARHNDAGKKNAAIKQISKKTIIAIAQSLLRYIEKLSTKEIFTEWGDYYKHTNYSGEASIAKSEIISSFLQEIDSYSTVWDFGANDGRYTRLSMSKGNVHAVAFDIDHTAVTRNYNTIKKTHESMLPLVMDLTAPSPSIGFANEERTTIGRRQAPDIILMLALVHHLAISNNLPLEYISRWLADLCRYLIIEFIPKEDSQVQILLNTREDIFPNYNEDYFEKVFGCYFTLIHKQAVLNSKRTIYLYKNTER